MDLHSATSSLSVTPKSQLIIIIIIVAFIIVINMIIIITNSIFDNIYACQQTCYTEVLQAIQVEIRLDK